jgi:hypothetical protein
MHTHTHIRCLRGVLAWPFFRTATLAQLSETHSPLDQHETLTIASIQLMLEEEDTAISRQNSEVISREKSKLDESSQRLRDFATRIAGYYKEPAFGYFACSVVVEAFSVRAMYAAFDQLVHGVDSFGAR